jgi:hypothetical protein
MEWWQLNLSPGIVRAFFDPPLCGIALRSSWQPGVEIVGRRGDEQMFGAEQQDPPRDQSD